MKKVIIGKVTGEMDRRQFQKMIKILMTGILLLGLLLVVPACAPEKEASDKVGVVVTVTVRLAGVVAVFAFLIIPASISALLSSRWTMRMLIAWTAAIIASAGGKVLDRKAGL